MTTPNRDVQDSASTPVVKRKRSNIPSPDAEILSQSKTIDICGHCNKKCTAKGPQSEAIQCDMCYSWVHVACEGLKKEQYKQITQLTISTNNLAYYCSLNQCASLNKKLIHDHLSSLKNNADTPTLRSVQAEQENLHRIISEVSNKLDNLTSQNRNLQKQIEDVCHRNDSLQNQITDTSKTTSQTAASTTESSTTTVLSIADELADRERRKNNLIIFNLPETSDQSKDIAFFNELCQPVFAITVKITKSLRLGKKVENKNRPLLISLENQNNTLYITSRAAYLRRHAKYENIYIVPDMTKYQRSKHKGLVDELKRRKANGEENLVIRNGEIVTRCLHAPNRDTTVPSPTDMDS